MGKVFLKRGDIYSQTEGNFSVIPTLDDGIYRTIQNPMTGEIFLDRIADSFEFNFKLYGLDEKLISHVVNTYNRQDVKHNLGVLLNGAKGTGKTVTAKYLCNKLGLPVIICDTPYKGLSMFLASITGDCIFFFDEFEKNFRLECGDDENCAGEDLLSIMDGVYNSSDCHIFILTTNELKVNDNLLCRPSRIRYLKSFGEVIDTKILEEYIDDNLIKKEYKDEIMEFIDTLTIATIDIVKSIVDEVNLHDVHVADFKDFFNVQESHYLYHIRYWQYYLTDNDEDFQKEDVFLGNVKKQYGEEKSFTPQWGTMLMQKSIKKFKVGERIDKNSRWVIKKIDFEKNYILLRDSEYCNREKHIYIEDIDVQPSLFSNNGFDRFKDPYWFDD